MSASAADDLHWPVQVKQVILSVAGRIILGLVVASLRIVYSGRQLPDSLSDAVILPEFEDDLDHFCP